MDDTTPDETTMEDAPAMDVTMLPDDQLLNCIARLSLARNPTKLPLVSSRFRSLATSAAFEQTRHANGFYEV